jgi:hypothetical protein
LYPHASPDDPHPHSFRRPVPRRRRERHGDPYAALIGNATLLGIGYLLLDRAKAFAVTLLVSAWLVCFAAVAPDTAPPRLLLLLWWTATMLHTCWLVRPGRLAARGTPLVDLHGREPERRSRLFAGAVLLLTLMAIVGIRFDAVQIVAAAEAAHREGDCERTEAVLAGFDATHRVADGALAGEVFANEEACELLLEAMGEGAQRGAATLKSYMDHPGAMWDGAWEMRARLLLDAALDPLDSESRVDVEEALDLMAAALDESPDRSRAVRAIAEDFVEDLAAYLGAECRVKELDEWLLAREPEHPALDEPLAAVSGLLPPAALECARATYRENDLNAARELYEEFLADHSDHELAAEAARELEEVETEIEREHVEDLLFGGDYCGSPAPYRGAEAYSGSGTNPMWLFGLDSTEYEIPDSWTTANVDETVLVVCVEGPERGSFIESCEYEDFDGAYLGSVSFYANEFSIKAYELRTGGLVEDYSVELGGSCPYVLTFYGSIDETRNVSYEPSDLRELFERLQ